MIFIQMWHLLEVEWIHHLPVVLGLLSLDCCSGVLEPVDDIVDIQRFLPLPRLKTVQDVDILLYLGS